MDKQISHIITESCKKNGITYVSCNENFVNFTSDAQLLVQLYKDLQQIAGKLGEIGIRHNIVGLDIVIDAVLEKINEIDHELILLSKRIREEEKC